MNLRTNAIAGALAAAALFGASTPFAKLLLGEVSPWLLAAVLYLGSGLGLGAWIALRPRSDPVPRIERRDWPWLAAAIASGGVVAPVLLLSGLAVTSAGASSLLLNLEAVFTALIAWTVFRENAGPRVFTGWLAIVAGGVLLAWEQAPGAGGLAGPLLVAAACLAWAIDNNLTRKVAGGDAALIACLKGLVAGAVNLVLALASGAALPAIASLAGGAVVGFLGYGVSLALFIVALRQLGTARTSAYFSIAPFFGAALALVLLAEQPGTAFWMAAALMALGVWLHVSERHGHFHVHETSEHAHAHVHDEHHRHAHAFEWDGGEPHTHPHRHEPLAHAHRHDPDLHHRHRH
ncbi:MAG: hypothetical protein A3I63_11585 [Betaproteobacteria bacterium RIFCSPLOWO2_02_FULL_66_14]|nr:MAG: hypothetical protein A3I63_11585 [Betaproteobacteria bacterium RIFCSPLOWO2_02_FULL_66_14]